jgi:hypothetical protein
VQRSYLFANDANVSYFSPDKSEKLLKRLLFFVGKKKAAGSFFYFTKGSTRKLVTNSWISSSN